MRRFVDEVTSDTRRRLLGTATGERQGASRRFLARVTRRRFLGAATAASAALAAPWIVPAAALSADGAVAPSERITVGLIGRGLMGRGHLRRLVGDAGVQVLGVCDVDRSRCEEGVRLVDETYTAERAAGTYRGCTTYNDYRELLARADLDAVVIRSRNSSQATTRPTGCAAVPCGNLGECVLADLAWRL